MQNTKILNVIISKHVLELTVRSVDTACFLNRFCSLTRTQQLLRWATVWRSIDMGRKVRAAVPLSRGGAGSPSNTMPSGPSPISVPIGISIHPAVWPQ